METAHLQGETVTPGVLLPSRSKSPGALASCGVSPGAHFEDSKVDVGGRTCDYCCNASVLPDAALTRSHRPSHDQHLHLLANPGLCFSQKLQVKKKRNALDFIF